MGVTEFENDELLRVLRAVLPFLDEEIQKLLYIVLKIIELDEIFVPDKTCENMSEEEKTEALLKTVRNELNEENKRKLDGITALLETKKLMSKMT